MYPEIGAIVDHAKSGLQRHPLIMCEFSHAMGNSNGTLAEYWDAIETTPGLQGGFIWEFWDHGLVQTLPDGTTRWAYGGDYGDEPNDGNFVMDGMVWPDRRPKPAMWEARALAAPIRLSGDPADLAQGRVTLANHQYFIGTEMAQRNVRGDRRRRRDLRRFVPAARDRPWRDGYRGAARLGGPGSATGEAFLDCSIHDSQRELLGARRVRGRGSATGLGRRRCPRVHRHRSGRARRRGRRPNAIELDDEGRLVHSFLATSPALSLWRCLPRPQRQAASPADGPHVGRRRRRSSDPAGLGLAVERDGATVTVCSEWTTRNGTVVPHEVRYTALADGAIAVAETATIPETLPDLARVGTVLETEPALEAFEWFGTGPHETYPDRKRLGLVGRWTSTVTDQYVPYVRPQENGGHADVRWFRLRDADDRGLRIDLDRPRQVSVAHVRASRRRRRPATRSGSCRAPKGSRHRRRPPWSGQPMRPRHLAGSTDRSARTYSLGLDLRTERSSMAITWSPATREFHLRNEHISYVLRVHEDGSLGQLAFGPALAAGRSYGHIVPGGFAGFSNRVGDPIALDYPTTGGGDYRIPALEVRHADGSTVLRLAYTSHRILAGKPPSRGRRDAADDLRRVGRRGRHPRDHPCGRGERADRRPALHDLRRAARRRAQRAAAERRPDPVRVEAAMSAVLDLPDSTGTSSS